MATPLQPVPGRLQATNTLILRVTLLLALTALISGLSVMATMDDLEEPKLVLSAFLFLCIYPLIVLLSQLRRLWPMRYWLTIFELLWLMIEVGGAVVVIWLCVVIADSENIPVPVVSSSALGMLSIFSLIIITRTSGIQKMSDIKVLKLPYTGAANDSRKGLDLLFGNEIFRRRFSTDNKRIQYVRGISALLVFLLITLLTIYLAIVRPWNRGVNWAEIQTFTRSWVGPGALEPEIFEKIYLTIPVYQQLTDFLNVTEVALDSLSVKLIGESVHVSNPIMDAILLAELSCTGATTQSSLLGPVVTVACPFNGTRLLLFGESLEISINFTEAFPGSNLNPEEYPQGFSIGMMLGFIGSTRNDLSKLFGGTPWTFIHPGYRSFGFCDVSMKEELFMEGIASAVGVQWKYQKIPTITAFTRVPFSETLANNSVGSLRITFNKNWSGYRAEREYNNVSIIEGFATLGGAWTFINGIFAAIFGSTLLLVLFERKPLSIYGVLHTLRGGELHLDPSDELSPEMQRRIVSLMYKHLMDAGEPALVPGDSTTACEDRPQQADTEQVRLLDGHELHSIASGPSTNVSIKND